MKRMLMAVAMVVATADLSHAGVERENLQIYNDISKAVQRYAYFTVFDDVNATIEGGVVTLTGRVTMPYKAEAIAERVAKVDGVNVMRNEIQTLPVSGFDDDLRYRIARTIYGNSAFWHYAAMANPPIHIIVERGHVRLTGVVHDEVERMLARSLATQFGAFSVTNELKTDAEVQAELEKL